MKKICFFFFLIFGFASSQNLEETIYVTTETFLSNKNESTFQTLKTKEIRYKPIVKTKEEQLALVFLQSHKSAYLHEISKLKEAILSYEETVNNFNENQLSKLSNFDIIENCLKPLGNLYTKTGDFTNALNTINQYIYLADKSQNVKHQISGFVNLSILYYATGEHQSAINLVENTLKIPNLSNNKRTLLINIKTSSFVALNQSNKASEFSESTSNSKFQKEKNKYQIALKKGEFNKAFKAFNKYKLGLPKDSLSNRDLSQLYLEEAQLLYVLDKSSEAKNALKFAIKTLLPKLNLKSLPNKNDLYAENKFIDIFDLYAQIEPDSETALKYYDLSFYVAKLLRENWTSQETKTLNNISNRHRSEKCITILFNAYRQTKNEAFLKRAFQYSESNKASVLKGMAQKILRLQKHPNDSLLIKEFNLIKQQEHFTNLLIKEQLGNNKSSKINNLGEELTRISQKLKALNISISKNHRSSNNAISLKILQQKLSKDEAVLTEYFYGKNYLYQFIISGTSIDLKQIPLNKTSKEAIMAFNNLFNDASIINNNISNYTKQAFRIYQLLNLQSLSLYKNVIIIPDEHLNFLPFEALLTSKTETTSFSKMPFVISHQNIAYSTNTFFYLSNIKPNKNNKVLGFFPVFDNTKQALTYSVNEAKVLEKEMTSNIYMNANANKSSFIKNASNYNIIHLSTHASSGDSAEPASISFFDDILTLNEIYGLDLKANLVVLSACETGIGKLKKAEGAMSVARGFQFAGAKNLLFSLWQINDLSTSKIMALFYKNYNKYNSAFIANHQSKLNYLNDNAISNSKKSPYYWSAFVYYGTITPANSPTYTVYIIVGLLIALLIVLLILKKRK